MTDEEWLQQSIRMVLDNIPNKEEQIDNILMVVETYVNMKNPSK
jgi:hypothetical protein